MSVRVEHLDFPVPRAHHLLIALLGRRWSGVERYLTVGSVVALVACGAGWWAPMLPLSAVVGELLWSGRSRRIRRNWTATRRRRARLNAPDQRARRQRALADHVATLAEKADYAWRAYMADAVVGRTQSVIEARATPKIQPLQQLDGIRSEADRLAIVLIDEEPSEGARRLTVPPETSFEPDTLSPTMMNLTTASIAHAKAEGPARARRRHEAALAHAAAFAPALAFAEAAVAALREPVIDDRRWFRRRPARAQAEVPADTGAAAPADHQR